MGRGTTRRKKAPESDRPSLFFIISLAVGVFLLMTLFIMNVSKPAKAPLAPKSGAIEHLVPGEWQAYA